MLSDGAWCVNETGSRWLDRETKLRERKAVCYVNTILGGEGRTKLTLYTYLYKQKSWLSKVAKCIILAVQSIFWILAVLSFAVLKVKLFLVLFSLDFNYKAINCSTLFAWGTTLVPWEVNSVSAQLHARKNTCVNRHLPSGDYSSVRNNSNNLSETRKK